MKVLVVVDMQKDFLEGPLAMPSGTAVIPACKKRIEEGIENGEKVIFLRDTHQLNYLETCEGKGFPFIHCVDGTEGQQIIDELIELTKGQTIIDKPVLGSAILGETLAEWNEKEVIEKVTFIGIYAEACVLNNMAVTRAYLHNAEIAADVSCIGEMTPGGLESLIHVLKPAVYVVENEA